ncbi:hypothetical protein [Parafrankia discariae]|uniref:hypothetical protein n=1 Tax=Parafrankia discariae TaxID=365528 RepID=UPI000977E83C|nr:hypothetical protein [Parafrankia discariae]
MRKRLVLTGMAIVSLAACGPIDPAEFPSEDLPSSVTTPSLSANPGIGIGDGAPTYVRQFRQQFPGLAQGKTDEQILGDGEADCSDMAAARELTTPSMAKRYDLSDSTADQFTLHNIALLATFTLCGIR